MLSTYDRLIRKVLNKTFLLDQENVCELWMVHHAEPGEIYAACEDDLHDPILSEKGLSQAFFVSKRLEERKVSAVYSCPCSNCLQTAETIAVPHSLIVTTLMDNAGVRLFANRPPDSVVPALREAMIRYQDEIERAFTTTGKWTAFPFCEMGTEFRRRITQAIDEVIDYRVDEMVVLVTDRTVINGYIAEVLGIPKDMWFYPEYGSIHIVRGAGEKRVLYRVNDISHFQDQER